MKTATFRPHRITCSDSHLATFRDQLNTPKCRKKTSWAPSTMSRRSKTSATDCKRTILFSPSWIKCTNLRKRRCTRIWKVTTPTSNSSSNHLVIAAPWSTKGNGTSMIAISTLMFYPSKIKSRIKEYNSTIIRRIQFTINKSPVWIRATK